MHPAGRPLVHQMGEGALLVECRSMTEVHGMRSALEANPIAGVEEIVTGARTLLLRLASPSDAAQVARLLPSGSDAVADRPAVVTIPVTYGGPDLDAVAGECGLSPSEIATRHASALYTVGFLGFSPGFAYLFGSPPELSVRRLATPRAAVPAGSVALAEDMTAVYPQSTPGGWRIIGRTPMVMFDPHRDPPTPLRPGDHVRFEPCDRPDSPLAVPLQQELVPPAPDRRAIEIVDTGPLLTVQDVGRRGWAHAGVPVAGAADSGAARAANQLVGNPVEAAVLEATSGACRIRLRADCLVAVTGGDADITVDGLPARRDSALPVRAGSELVIGWCRSGLRVYLALAGGVDAPLVLGSRSTDTLSGLGPAPLRPGDRLALGPAGPSRPPGVSPPLRSRPPISGGRVGLGLPSVVVEARWGPRQDWLSGAGRALLSTTAWTVSSTSDRTGVRLDGPALPVARRGGIPSEGMVAGAVQLPPGGGPIVLMRNHPPTGGYPVVAVVTDAGVDALAQAPPGTVVSFEFRP